MPELRGCVAVVTGGNSGIGFETVLALLRKHCTVYIATHNEASARNALVHIGRDPTAVHARVEVMRLDLASFRSIENFAKEFRERESKLDMLFNNAGVLYTNAYGVTVDGIETHMGVNALGHYYLTLLLIPALNAAVRSNTSRVPRVCFTSCAAHSHATKKGFDPDDVYGTNSAGTGSRGGFIAYANSKMANVLSAYKLQRMYGNDGITFTAVNPGHIRTHLLRNISNLSTLAVNHLAAPFMYSPREGAITQLYANTAPEIEDLGTLYFVPWARPGVPSSAALSTEAQDASTFLLLHTDHSGRMVRRTDFAAWGSRVRLRGTSAPRHTRIKLMRLFTPTARPRGSMGIYFRAWHSPVHIDCNSKCPPTHRPSRRSRSSSRRARAGPSPRSPISRDV